MERHYWTYNDDKEYLNLGYHRTMLSALRRAIAMLIKRGEKKILRIYCNNRSYEYLCEEKIVPAKIVRGCVLDFDYKYTLLKIFDRKGNIIRTKDTIFND